MMCSVLPWQVTGPRSIMFRGESLERRGRDVSQHMRLMRSTMEEETGNDMEGIEQEDPLVSIEVMPAFMQLPDHKESENLST